MKKKETELTAGKKQATMEEFAFHLPPIKGYPELRWAGKRPFRSTHYYPAQLKENHGEAVDGWMNEIYWGDNLQVMSHLLKKYRGQVKLIYIDPPFDSKADYKKKIQLKGKSVANDQGAFEEKQYTDIWTNDEYLQFMYERLILMRELLADDGSLYLHCDWHKGHYLHNILNEIFGYNNFRSQIIWKKTTKTTSINNYGSEHDMLFYCLKGNSFIFNQAYKALKETELLTKYIYLESANGDIIHLTKKQIQQNKIPEGRRFRGIPLLNMNKDRPNLNYEFMGYKRVWAATKDKLDILLKKKMIFQIDGGLPQKKGYLDENPGAKVNDIWDDINPINSQAKERIDYPTQKPEALIERIINISSNPGDLIFDCFMGSGTTQAVAMKLGRRFIGADINLGAIQITTKRLLQAARGLEAAEKTSAQQELFAAETTPAYNQPPQAAEPPVRYTGFSVYNVNNYDIFRNPVQARDLLLEALEIQKLPGNILFDGEKDSRMVKIMPVNRITTRADLNELIGNLDYKAFEKRQETKPGKPVESITLICMGHEPDLAAAMQEQVPFKLDIEVVDILRDRQDIQFKRDAEAEIVVKKQQLVIKQFYPLNLLRKLSLRKENVEDWRELVESIMIDFNYDGGVFEPTLVDVPEKNELVKGSYPVPRDAGTIRVKITDLLSESLEQDVH